MKEKNKGSLVCAALTVLIIAFCFFALWAVGRLLPDYTGIVEKTSKEAAGNLFFADGDKGIVVYPWDTFSQESCMLLEQVGEAAVHETIAVAHVTVMLETMSEIIFGGMDKDFTEQIYISKRDDYIYIPDTPVAQNDGSELMFSMAFTPDTISYIHVKSADNTAGDSGQEEQALALLEEFRQQKRDSASMVDSWNHPIPSPSPSPLDRDGMTESSVPSYAQPSPSSYFGTREYSENPYAAFLWEMRAMDDILQSQNNEEESGFYGLSQDLVIIQEALMEGECTTLYWEGETLLSFYSPEHKDNRLILFFGQDSEGSPRVNGYSLRR